MKRAVLFLSLVLLASTLAAAQATAHSNFAPTSGNQASTNHTASAPANDLRGCLSGAKSGYELLDHEGKAHKVTGETHLLSDEVGHEVDMTGKVGSGNTFHETSVTDIASRCWNFQLN